ncbi:MAG: hypothetical protein IT357_04880 [Gemmatimonadaceae bacterium]|nr:hypothetical protein [Gemmatimonadaceae bacterium]
MRLRLVAPLLCLAAAACTAPTDLDTAVINVQVRDDIGRSAGRNEVIIRRVDAPDATRRVDTGTNTNGHVSVRLRDSGTYEVLVIPTATFSSSPSLRRTVTVIEGERVVLAFTLYRAGWSEPDQNPTREYTPTTWP